MNKPRPAIGMSKEIPPKTWPPLKSHSAEARFARPPRRRGEVRAAVIEVGEPSCKRRRQHGDQAAALRFGLVAVLGLGLLAGSLLGLGAAFKWYFGWAKPHHPWPGRVRVPLQQNNTGQVVGQVTSVFHQTTGWIRKENIPTTTSTTTTTTTTTSTTRSAATTLWRSMGPAIPRVRITNAQMKDFYYNQWKPTQSPPPTSTFGLPKRKQVVTLVTALLDIGRGYWQTYGRPLSKYHDAMKNVLALRVPMVVFTDQHSLQFIYNVTMEDLPLHRHSRLFHEVINKEQNGGWRGDWDPAMKTHPEAHSADYDIVVNSKPYFLFNASSFAWIDAGYGQGDSRYFPGDSQWYPIFPADKISVIKLTPSYDLLTRYTEKVLYRRDEAVISGGFLGGNRRSLARLYSAFHWKVVEMLFRKSMVDDDQTTLVLVINEQPDLFDVVHGDWHDAFRLF